MDEYRELLLASHAMWVGDFEGALSFYTKIQNSERVLDPLLQYRINFDLVVIGTMLKKDYFAKTYLGKLEKSFQQAEEIIAHISDRPEKSLEAIQAVTIRQFLQSKQFDRKKISNILQEYFPTKEGALALFISPRYARISLRNIIRNAEKGNIPQVLEGGIFKYTLSSELYRVIGRAYSVFELELEELNQFKKVKILVKNSNVYYLEDEELRTIASVYREGIVFCNYLVQNSQDTSGAERIHAFLENISKVFSRR